MIESEKLHRELKTLVAEAKYAGALRLSIDFKIHLQKHSWMSDEEKKALMLLIDVLAESQTPAIPGEESTTTVEEVLNKIKNSQII